MNSILKKHFTKFFILMLLILSSNLLANPSGKEGWVEWTYKTDGIIYAKPIIKNDILFVGSLDKNFYALNAETGNLIWSFSSDGPIYTTAVLGDDFLCFKGGNTLYNLDLNGNLNWEKKLPENFIAQNDNWDYYHSSPIIHNNVIYIGSEKGKVYGVSLLDTTIVFQAKALSETTIETTPLVYENIIFVGDYAGVLTAFNLESGEIIWEYDTRKDKDYSTRWANHINTQVVIYNKKLYFGGKNCRMTAVNPLTGELVTQYVDKTDQWLVGGPTIDNGYLYFGSSNQHVLHKVNAETSELIWKISVGSRVFATPLLIDNVLYFGTGGEANESSGSFYAVNIDSGNILNSYSIYAQLHSSPTFANGKIYFGAANKKIYAIEKNKFCSGVWSDTTNIALGKPTFASSELSDKYISGYASDGRLNTEWSSAGKGIESVYIDLENEYEIAKVIIRWGRAKYAKSFNLQTAIDTSTWEIAAEYHNNYSEIDTLSTSMIGRYLKIEALEPKSILSKYSIVEVEVYGKASTTSIEKVNNKILDYKLDQNYPNPFNPSTKIDFTIPMMTSTKNNNPLNVQLSVYDVLGNKIKTLINEPIPAGQYTVTFNSENLPSGVYFYSLNSGNINKTKKMILLK